MPLLAHAAVALGGAFALSISLAAAETPERGRQLLRQNCGSCHAIAPADRSVHPAAPPFRWIGRRHDIDALTERMRDILVSTHADMPSFRFSRTDARAIRIYLHSIQD